jgi:HSP20 family protein
MSSMMVGREPYQGVLSLQNAMDRLLRDSFVGPSTAGRRDLASVALDVYETDEELVVKATVPGIKPEDIKVTVVGSTVTIEGETKCEDEVTEEHYVLRERSFGRFSRSVTLPRSVNAEGATAEFEHGVLTLSIPKAEEAKTRSIKIKAK